MIMNYPPQVGGGEASVNQIKTDITWIKGSLESVVSQRSRMEIWDGRLIKKGKLTLGGRDAFRMWFTDSSFDFPDTIVTYVRGTSTQTAVISSFYTASNPAAVDLIQRIQGSFNVLQ